MVTTKIKTLSEIARIPGTKCLIIKKGKKYLTVKNNELALTSKQGSAVTFKNDPEIRVFMLNALLDTRNAQTIGKRYNIVDINF